MPQDHAPAIVLSYSEAAAVVRQQATLLAQARARDEEDVSLQQAVGRVLAAPVLADRDQPPFHRATRDGFACRAAELNARPLRITGLVKAGEVWRGTLEADAAVEIMTGAPVPSGADCIVMLEHTVADNSTVRVSGERRLLPGENIVSAGSEAARGALLLPAGTRLGAQHIAVAAACGYPRLRVFGRPRIAVQTTGDELVEVGVVPLPFQIRNSNSYSLAAQIAQCGGEPLILPILGDSGEATRAAILETLNGKTHNHGAPDLLILSGGVSMGRFDFVEAGLRELGAEFFFTGARIQPGRPIVFGRLPRMAGEWMYFFGLPGNPVSTMVTFCLFVNPVLHALSGEAAGSPRFALAILDGELESKAGMTRFLPAILEAQEFAPRVRPIRWQGSGDLAGNAKANCYVVVPGEVGQDPESLAPGETVSVLLIG